MSVQSIVKKTETFFPRIAALHCFPSTRRASSVVKQIAAMYLEMLAVSQTAHYSKRKTAHSLICQQPLLEVHQTGHQIVVQVYSMTPAVYQIEVQVYPVILEVHQIVVQIYPMKPAVQQIADNPLRCYAMCLEQIVETS